MICVCGGFAVHAETFTSTVALHWVLLVSHQPHLICITVLGRADEVLYMLAAGSQTAVLWAAQEGSQSSTGVQAS